MSLPKKYTQTLSLRNGQTFLWHLNPDWWHRGRYVAVQQENLAGQMLLIELFGYDFIPGKTAIRAAIRAAFRNGWTPDEKKKPLRLRYNGSSFAVADCDTTVVI